MDPQLKAQLNQTVEVAERSAIGSDGRGSSYGAWVEVAARVETMRVRVAGPEGGIVYADKHLIITEGEIPTKSRVRIGGASGNVFTAESSMPCPAENGSIDHYETEV